MAKKSMVARELKRTKLAERYEARRQKLRDVLKSEEADYDEKMEASRRLQQLPRDSSKTRGRNRCRVTGRPHGYYRKFGLSRNKLREAAMRGDVPGLSKASW
jgi:small subunit ribosomal protein S14